MSISSPLGSKQISTGERRIRSQSVTRSSALSGFAHSEFTHIASPIPRFFTQKSGGTREVYCGPDLEGQLRNTIVGRMTNTFANSQLALLDMSANQVALADKIADQLKPGFVQLGLSLDSFVVENLSLPDEPRKILDQRISMNMVGHMGRYTQFEVAQSIPTAAPTKVAGLPVLGPYSEPEWRWVRR